MPMFIAALLGGFRMVAGSLALQVLVGLGVGVLTVVGVDLTVNHLINMAKTNLNGLPAELLGLLGFLRVGDAIGVIVGAMTTRMTITMIQTGTGALAIKKFFKL